MTKLKNIFGKPGTGIHSYRICDVALFDYIFVIIFCIIISCYINLSIELITIIVLIIGILLHYIIDVDTNTTKYIKSLF